MPVLGGTTAKFVEGGLAPAQERVALAVALELELGVALEREPLGEHVHLDRVVDHELDRHERVDPGRVAAEVLHRVAHRGQVHDRRHAGEVLHQHARGREGDLAATARRRRPRWRAFSMSSAVTLCRPRCAAGSRAGPSASTAGGPRRSATGARRGGRSRASRRRPRASRGLRSCRDGTRFNPIDGHRPDSVRPVHDLACVIHLHSVHSDGTGTVRQIVRARPPRRARRGAAHRPRHARPRSAPATRAGTTACCCWWARRSRRRGATTASRSAWTTRSTASSSRADYLRAIRAAGGLSFAAHPLSRGSRRFKRAGTGMPFAALESEDLDGMELWSFVTDTARDVREPPRGAPLHRRARAGARAPARAQHARVGPPLPHAPRGGDRRARRAPDRQAHRPGGAAPADGLQALVPVPAHARPLPRAAERRAGARPRAGVLGAARRALLPRDGLARTAARLQLRGGRPRDGRRRRRPSPRTLPSARARAGRPAPAPRRLAGRVRRRGHGAAARGERPGRVSSRGARHAHGRSRTWIVSNPIYLR